MANEIKIRAKAKDGVASVKCLISHIMETGTRRDSKTGEIVPAHFIEEVTCKHNGKVVMSANWGPAVSKDPYMSFKFKGAAKGDSVTIAWRDNKGESESTEAKIR
jgi:sulfur-oxidizing protein SoxZ